jgi:hypothetical protein
MGIVIIAAHEQSGKHSKRMHTRSGGSRHVMEVLRKEMQSLLSLKTGLYSVNRDCK